MPATAYNTTLRTPTTQYSGDTMRIAIGPNGFPSAFDQILIAATIAGQTGQSPIPPTSAVMSTDGSSAFVEITFPSNFTATTYQVTLGTAGNSNTLGLPITPSVFSVAVQLPAAQATGQIITESSLQGFMGANNLQILSSQSNAATSDNVPAIQYAINAAEARLFGKLNQLQCSSGTFFKYPFTVGGVAIGTATSSAAYSILSQIAHQYAGFILNRWRSVVSIGEDASGAPAAMAMTGGWEKRADKEVTEIIRWAQGFSDGVWVDLDLNKGAVVGVTYRSVTAPVYAGQQVNPDGSPAVNLYDNAWAVWPAFGYYPVYTYPFRTCG